MHLYTFVLLQSSLEKINFDLESINQIDKKIESQKDLLSKALIKVHEKAPLIDKKSSKTFFANIIARIANTNPKIAPSQLFFGLTRGNNLCLPSAVPPKNAAESQIQIVAKIEIIKYPP